MAGYPFNHPPSTPEEWDAFNSLDSDTQQALSAAFAKYKNPSSVDVRPQSFSSKLPQLAAAGVVAQKLSPTLASVSQGASNALTSLAADPSATYEALGGPNLSQYGLSNAITGPSAQTGSMFNAPFGGIGQAAGAYGAYDVLTHKYGPVRGGLEGAASGYALGGPPGAIIGAVVGAGKGFLDKPSTKDIQKSRWESTSHPELADKFGAHDYFEGTGGEESRDEKFLTPDAIRFNPDNYNNVSNWDKWNKATQDKFMQTLLNEGKVQEKKGGIYYDDARAKELAAQLDAEGLKTSGASSSTHSPSTPSKKTSTKKVPPVSLENFLPQFSPPTQQTDYDSFTTPYGQKQVESSNSYKGMIQDMLAGRVPRPSFTSL